MTLPVFNDASGCWKLFPITCIGFACLEKNHSLMLLLNINPTTPEQCAKLVQS